MSVDPNRVETIFHAALALPAADRGAFLAAECGADAELRARVERLLAAHDELGEPDAGPRTEDHTPQPDVGTLVGGKYKLLEEIGEGGMGTVWMAQQTEPVKRTVAVKLIKAGMDSRAVLARFEAERQALALMDHPNIARVFDGGATPDGRPFFVMELVKGVPITQYCDERKLNPRQRLELFVPVCNAIQHAHQKGVIHRDIKPSNVLIALYDDKPVPKVIDFGVAKAAGQPLTEKTLATGFGAVVGTPEYMSPEQASFNNLDIDTRSDVYALGVLLYELLAGSPPFSRKDLEKVGLLEIFRVIREQEPPRPSTKLSTADALPSLSANRGTEPKALTRLLRGELDWIVMKALEKDRNRRYETANGFAADVQRYLAGEPVQAVPPSAGYLVRKFLKRNKGPVLVSAALVLTLVGGATAAAVGWVRAARAEREASALAESRGRVMDFIETDLLGSPEAERGDLRGAVYRACRQLDARFRDDHHVREYLHYVLAGTLVSLRDYAGAAAEYEVLHARSTDRRGADDKLTLMTAARLGGAYAQAGDFARAEPVLRPALALAEARYGPVSEEAHGVLAWLCYALVLADRYADAEPYLRRRVARLRATDPDGEHLTATLDYLGTCLRETGHPAEAEAVYTEVLDRVRRAHGADHLETSAVVIQLGELRMLARDLSAAEAHFRRAVAIRERAIPTSGWQLPNARSFLGAVLAEQRKFDEAGPLLREAHAALATDRSEADPKERHRRLVDALDRLVRFAELSGDPEEVRWRAERAKYPFVAPRPREKK